MTVKSKIIYWLMGMFTMASLVRMLGVCTGWYEYTFDAELIEFTRCAVVAALGIETFTRVRQLVYRRNKE